MMSRTRLITAASFAESLGWGTILPFQFAYVVDARHWGATVGILTGTAFCLGAVFSAPLAGRLADRFPAGRLAVLFSLAAAVSCLGLGLADSPRAFLIAMALFGASVTAVNPPVQVLVLEAAEPEHRRAAFAYQFTALALGMAAGAFAAGWMIDLHSPNGMWPAFLAATAGFVVSGYLLQLASAPAVTADVETADEVAHAGSATDTPVASRPASSTAPATSVEPAVERPVAPVGRSGLALYRELFANRRVRLLALVSMALAAGFYAQFETGLPAFALQSLSLDPSTVGTAAAANCLVIVALQWLVVKLTGRAQPAALLIVVAGIWAMSWLLLEAALFTGSSVAGVLFVVSFMTFGFGETMYAPVLSPLTAAVTPPGMLGTTLGTLSALRTGISALGPLLAGVFLALDVPHVFVLVHVGINTLGGIFAWKLLRAQRADDRQVDNRGVDPARSVHV
jgi:MFS family permease